MNNSTRLHHAPERPLARIMPNLAQRLPLQQSLAHVKAQDSGCHRTDIRHRLDHDLMERKMVRPAIHPGVEKAAEPACFRDDGADIASLVAVAERAGVSQIFRFSRPTMLFADDVVYLATKEGIVRMDKAVFTEMISSLGDQPPKSSAEVAQVTCGSTSAAPWPWRGA